MKAIGEGVLQRRRENRTRIDIMTCILRKSQVPTRKTKIMRSCGLSSKQAVDMLGVLRLNDLIEKNEEPTIYLTTEKGYEFLGYYDRLSQLLRTEAMGGPRSRSEPVVVGNDFCNHYSTKRK